MTRIRPWKSRREILLENKRALDDLAALSGKPPMEFKTRIPPPPKACAPRDPDKISESTVNDRIRRWTKARPNITLYRNNRGVIPLSNGARLTYGVGPNGASDWIGYRSVVVTPEMLGTRVAIFTAIEAKAPGEKTRADQSEFIQRVADAGGIAGVAHDEDDLDRILGG